MKPRAIWLCFAACLAVLGVALGWVTRNTLRMERQQQASARLADYQQKARLALWRMDGAASALIIREGARPPEQFRAFTAPSMAWNASYQMLDQSTVVVPSPLVTEQNEHVKLYFELKDSDLSSPQSPRGDEEKVALACFNTSMTRIAEGAHALVELRSLLAEQVRRGQGVPCLPAPEPGTPVTYSTPSPVPEKTPEVAMVSGGSKLMNKAKSKSQSKSAPDDEVEKSKEEFSKRAQAFKNNQSQSAPEMKALSPQDTRRKKPSNNVASLPTPPPPPALQQVPPPPVALPPVVPETVGPFQAAWIGGELFLIREVRAGATVRHQGVWLNWPSLRDSLLQDINDLFPEATLKPTAIPAPPGGQRAVHRLTDLFWHGASPSEASLEKGLPMQFVALPVKLQTGHTPPVEELQWTPFRRSLAIAWGCVLLAALAVAILLRGTLALSERRAAFVSAVTHELRTPLTTFRLYTEILSNGMLPTEAKRVEYLATLQAESERLSHLVENVLAYARLERGRAQRRAERLTLSELVARVRPALERRVELVQARLAVDEGEERDLAVEVDVAAVEQILFNLVDNACKYAAPDAEEKTIHLETGVARGMALLRVRDHGRGIQRSETRRIFRPFHKSAQQAATSAPGVGLGLALCRKLSRALGGDIRLDTRRREAGACFVLEMPLSAT